MHLCCNGSLQTGTKIIAVVNMIVAIPIIVVGIMEVSSGDVLTSLGLHEAVNKTSLAQEDIKAAAKLENLAIFIIVIGVFTLLMEFALLVGAFKRNSAMCKMWLVLTLMGIMFLIKGIIKSLAAVAAAEPLNINDIISSICWILVHSYCACVVLAFIGELEEESDLPEDDEPDLPEIYSLKPDM